MKKYIFYFFLVFTISKFISSCANIIPPGGGPRDTLPPVLVSALPKDSALHFNANKITLQFDEYVELDNSLQTELVVSPFPISPPFVESKLKTVTIKLKDSLIPNITYSINFGKALKDVNEGNILRNFTYVFSTGTKINNGRLSGKALVAETGDVDSTLIVVLHSNLNDSAVKKIKPDYYARIDGKGNFRFAYLPSGKFAVYVLPNDYTKRYDDSTKLFAFLDEPVEIDSNMQSVSLYAYQEQKRKEKPATASQSNNKKKTPEKKSLRLIANLQEERQDLLGPLVLIADNRVAKFDSTKIILSDTNFKAIAGYTFKSDTSHKIFTLNYPWKEEEYFKLIIQQEAFTDTSGNTIAKTDTISFNTKKESDYGSLRLRFNNIDLSKNPVIQFVKGEQVIDSIPLTGRELYRKLYPPGEYEIRVLYDNNKNGTWDPGNFDLKHQPEIVQQIPKKLSIRGNWDNEVDINL